MIQLGQINTCLSKKGGTLQKPDINSTEIARIAGVSRSTVSRVINNYPNVPEKTKEKILGIIREYNYVPNTAAQVLKGKKTKTIGFFLLEVGEAEDDFMTSQLIAKTIQSASAEGYYVLANIIHNRKDQKVIRGIKDMFNQKRIDGAIFIGAINSEPFIEELISEGRHIAVIDQKVPGRRQPNCIEANFDNLNGTEATVAYLKSLRHTKIAYIQGDLGWRSFGQRYQAFRDSMQKHGLQLREEWMLPGGYDEQAGRQAAEALLRQGGELPTAIVAANDIVAFGVMRLFTERGLRVPDDISIVGYDDHPLSSRLQPGLTTVKIDFPNLMNQTVLAAIRNIESTDPAFQSVEVGSEFIVRQSCRAI